MFIKSANSVIIDCIDCILSEDYKKDKKDKKYYERIKKKYKN